MLDLRLPVGLFFLIVGVIVGVYGFVHPVAAIGTHININLDWGAVMLVFGLLMAGFGGVVQWRATAGAAPQDPAPPK